MSRLTDAMLRAAGEGRTFGPLAHQADEGDTPFSSPWDFNAPVTQITPSEHTIVAVRPTLAARPGRSSQPPVAPTPLLLREPHQTDHAPSIRLDSLLKQKWQPFAPEVVGRLVVTQIGGDAVEQYRHAAGALEHVQKGRELKTVMVASALAGEGRTLTAANLALTLSEFYGRHVLLVDAHIRHPRLHHIFQVSAGEGLTGCLRSASGDLPTCVELTKNLMLLPAGRREGSAEDTLRADSAGKLIAAISARFDWVILDSGPACEQPDAGVLSRLTDGIVLVVQASRTPVGTIEQTLDLLGRERVLGVVLNQAGDSAPPTAAATRDYPHPYSA